MARYQIKKQDDDESSEGRRYSYKKKKPDEEDSPRWVKRKRPQAANKPPVRKPVPHADERAKAPRRAVRKPGAVIPGKPKSSFYGGEVDDNFTKETPRERHQREQNRETNRLVRRDRQTDRIYRDTPRPPRPIDDRSDNPPERRPHPMQTGRVGPVEDMEEIAAHRYGYTPNAYKELRQIPTRMAPPEEGAPWAAGLYYPDTDSIYLDPRIRTSPGGGPDTLAHEQAHAWWFRRGLEGGRGDKYINSDFPRWREQQPLDSASLTAQHNMDEAVKLGMYGEVSRPTETYARTVEFSPDSDRSDWPDYVRPYYSGFLQGMGKLSTGEDTPPAFSSDQLDNMTPDENGLYGSYWPTYNDNPYRNWR